MARSCDGGRPPPVTAHLLGPVRLSVGQRQLPDAAWSRRSARSLFLLLLATPGHRLPRDRVLDLLWPERTPAAALNALYVALHGLRRTLEPELPAGRASAYVEAGGDSVGLRPHPDLWVDTDVFESALTEAETLPPPTRPAALRAALAVYGGDLLADEPYADWPAARREWLRGAWRRAVVALADLETRGGRPRSVVSELERLVATDPGDEAALRALMRALAAAGQRDEALRHYERGAHALRHELGVEPDAETRALATEIRSVDRPPARPLAASIRIDNLPTPPTPLVGRAREIEAVQDRLWDRAVRLVSVTGAGGIGKTRLALEAARQVAADFADGVCFVPLAPIADPRLVLPTIAHALGIEEPAGKAIAAALHERLQDREVLLLLDNFEQVIEAAPELAELLAGCPRLKLLVTSREPLRLRAEHELPTPPLSVPPLGRDVAVGRPTAAAALRYEAVALFVDRALAVKPSFAATDGNAGAIAALCVHLDGLPLAIELAAARSRHLSPDRLLSGLADRFALLAGGYRDLPPRQRTMRDAIGWSYDLLELEEQALFRRLAVFVGGWTLEAAEAVAAEASDPAIAVLDRIGSLVDQSLVRQVGHGADERAGEPRFGMLETIREYGLEQLAASGEAATIARRHAAWCLALAERAEPELTGPEQATWLEWLETEHDNLRAALTWAIGQDEAETALRLAGALWRFWLVRGYLIEGWARLEEALQLPAAAPPTPAARAKALGRAGDLARRLGNLTVARDRQQQSLASWCELGERRGEAIALTDLGLLDLAERDYATAGSRLEEALAIQRLLADRVWQGQSLLCLGRVAHHRGDPDAARRFAAESLATYRAAGDATGMILALHSLIYYAVDRNDVVAARTALAESLTLCAGLGFRWGTTGCLEAAAALAAAHGQPERAVRLAGAVEALREPLGAALPPDWRGDFERLLAPARRALGEGATVDLWAEGRTLSVEQALLEAGAVADDGTPPVASAAPSPRVGVAAPRFTPREREVLRLVAAGRTNREIGAALSIGPRTVAWHLANLYAKLGLASRAAAAAYATRHGLA